MSWREQRRERRDDPSRQVRLLAFTVWLAISLVACLSYAPDSAPDASSPEFVPVEIGVYDATWTCLDGCIVDFPLQYLDELQVNLDGRELVLRRAGCDAPECIRRATLVGEPGDVCMPVSKLLVGDDAAPTFPLCGTEDGVTALIAYQGYPGPAELERVWRLDGARREP